MAAEGTGRGELAQLVTDHILGDIHGNVTAAVVDGDTAMVCPTKDGKIVEERLQVLTTCLLPLLFISSTLFSSSGAAKGPFLMLLLIYDSLLT